MKEKAKQIYSKFRNLILYGVIGCFTASLDFCVFTLLSQVCDVYYIIANTISVLIGISTSFILNRSINFKVKDHAKRRFVIFLIVGLCGYLLSSLILYIGIDTLGAEELVVKLVSIVMVVFFQFLLNKFVTFKVS